MCKIIPDSLLFLLVLTTTINFQVNASPYLPQIRSESSSQSPSNGAGEVPTSNLINETAVLSNGLDESGVQEDDDDETTSKYGGAGKPQLFSELNQLLKVIFTAGQATAATGQTALNAIRGTKTSNSSSTSNKAPVKTNEIPSEVPIRISTTAPAPVPVPAPLPQSGSEEEENEEKTAEAENSNPDPEINEEEESKSSQIGEEEYAEAL